MRIKTIITAVLFIAILVTSAMIISAYTQPTAPPAETPQLEQEKPGEQKTEPLYTALTYGGLDVNPTHDYAHYDTADKDFITKIWETAGYAQWAEYGGETQAMVTIELRFTGSGDEITLQVDPNDIGWVTDDLAPWERAAPTYYAVPTGTYAKLSRLLTGYSEQTAKNNPADDAPKLEVIQDSLIDGVYTRFLLTIGGKEVYFDGEMALNRHGDEELIIADLTGDGIKDTAVFFTKSHGTGVSVPDIHIFDGVTLERYTVKDAVEIANEQVKASADDNHFYVAYGSETLIINKAELDTPPENLSSAPAWGNICYYEIHDGYLYAAIAVQVSPAEFYGAIRIKYEFTANGFEFDSLELLSGTA
jgi:hypothetical protein